MKKSIKTILFSAGLLCTLIIPASAYSKSGSCNNIDCTAVLNMSGSQFYAGTYADSTMKNISVSLDGKSEWWQDKDDKTDSNRAEVNANIKSIEAWSVHHADNNNGDDFDRSLGFKNGSFYRR